MGFCCLSCWVRSFSGLPSQGTTVVGLGEQRLRRRPLCLPDGMQTPPIDIRAATGMALGGLQTLPTTASSLSILWGTSGVG